MLPHDGLVVAASDKKTFDVFHAQLQEKFPVNHMGDLSLYLGCVSEFIKVKGFVKMRQSTFVGLLVEGFDIQRETYNPASVEINLG